MAQHIQSTAGTASVVPTDPRDDVEIFSAPAIGVIFHWWAESNRRWAEENKTRLLRPVAARESAVTTAVPVACDNQGSVGA
jgi:hypothetical protein